MKKRYSGSCHCGAIRYEADIDFGAGTFKCNCPICSMTRNWAAMVQPEAFHLQAGEADLKDYQPNANHHVFCKICGVRSFAWGDNPALGGKFYAVRISCLEPLDVNELMKAPVTYYDGLNDNYESSPAEIRHL